jgi:GNAT superfamily N-acetyltransferase
MIAGFTCGVESLDRYLRTQAGQDVRRRANGVFVLTDKVAPDRVLGYYTLCATALPPGEVSEAARKHIPRYPLASATLIGRLAVASDRQGQRLGAVLLADALRRALASAELVGSSMVVVDALDDGAAAFYRAHGFVRLPESLRLVLPMRLVERLVASSWRPPHPSQPRRRQSCASFRTRRHEPWSEIAKGYSSSASDRRLWQHVPSVAPAFNVRIRTARKAAGQAMAVSGTPAQT